jgi:hypothetical protein
MVMVLLFLGVVFLLVGFQAMGSGGDDSDQSTIAATTTTTTPTSTSAPAAARPEVRVFNISTVEGAAQGTADRLRQANWNVVETGNLELPNVTATTVYFSDAPGEREAADEVGRLLQAPVEPRVPELSNVPPGLVVVVTG